MNTCTSPCPRTSLALSLAPHEPICFASCDGPHSGVADDKRPPHRDDVAAGYLHRPSDQLLDVEAAQWAGYGFTAAEVIAWYAAGLFEASVAAECRAAGFDPSQEVDRRFLLSDDPETARPWCDLLNDSDVTAEQAMAAWKAAP